MAETPGDIQHALQVAAPEAEQARCANCGTVLVGPWCHACGQHDRTALKHLPALLDDGLDLLLNVDGRLLRTLPALLLRPGFLAREYFAGRRTRYIPPFRLMFFLSVLAFLVIQLDINSNGTRGVEVASFAADTTPAQVRADLNRALAQIDAARQDPDLPAVGRSALELSANALRTQANQRLRELGAAPAATAAAPPLLPADALVGTAGAGELLRSIATAPDRAELARRTERANNAVSEALVSDSLAPQVRAQLDDLRHRIYRAMGQREAELSAARSAATSAPAAPAGAAGAAPAIGSTARRGANITLDMSDLEHLPSVHVGWLPDFADRALSRAIARARDNIHALRSGDTGTRQRLVAATLSVLPQTLLVLLPLFALLLKIVYLFKRRLYIEHLIVAMYSHAFIFLTLLLSALLVLVGELLPDWSGSPLGWLQVLIWCWLPLYLLLAQKRIYAQGWFFTLLKYGVVGVCYTVMMSMAVAAAALIGLAA
ncbi:MAG TPA: DUF3667 domain-containing protein [Rhodanobacteraceae bacterium]|nr:DUF3667 domain-containing protein [Rhodanobacteraceae bacterium]